MSSKQEILKAIRAQNPPPMDLPSLSADWITYEDRYAQFKTVLEGVGGRCERISSLDEIPVRLATIESFQTAKEIVSAIPSIVGNVKLEAIDDPHQLETVDWAILPAQIGVAENGAMWVTDEQLKHRVIYFIVQHLSLVLPMSQLVNNMHEAYEKIAVGNSSFGAFVSGPSKTADIEQSLVIGAHGPRSLTVFCYDDL